MNEIHKKFVLLVSEMIKWQDEYFDNGRNKSDLIRYKQIKSEVKKYIDNYNYEQSTFYCEKNLDTEGIEKCEFQCEKCQFQRIQEDSKHYFTHTLHHEYERLLKDSEHLQGDERIEYEVHIVKKLDELSLNILGKSFAKQIELNKRMKICSKDLPNPFERYFSFYCV